MTSKPVAGTAVLAIVIGGAALLWHLLACIESPMAYSPSGKDLALVTMEPFDDQDLHVAGTHAYRLFVLSEGKQLRTVEETTASMLTAPAYSPDGKQFCYLRIPLLSAAQAARVEEQAKKYDEAKKSRPEVMWEQPTSAPAASAPATGPATIETTDHALPALEGMVELCDSLEQGPAVPIVLVVREVASGNIASTTHFELPLPGLAMAYVTLRPQFSPDGQSVYLCAGDVAVAVNPAKNEARILGAPAAAAALSPDGKTLAILQKSALGFIDTTGESAFYRRWERNTSLGGLTWADKHTLAVLEATEDSSNLVLHYVEPDGTLRKSVAIHLPEHGKHEGVNTGALALAPDGQHVVLAFEHDVFFLKADGTSLKHWHSDNEQLAQPTFAPDSQRVAFKLMPKEEGVYLRAAAIVFYTPAGEEVSRVAVPKIDPATTRPAGEHK
jgi:hypothetical protein